MRRLNRWYSADIGFDDHGRVIRFQAENHNLALHHALFECNGDERVIKLRVNAKPEGNANEGLGDLIWDEINSAHNTMDDGWY